MNLYQLQTFAPPNAEFKQLVESRAWDKIVRLFDLVTGQEKARLLSAFIRYLLAEGYLILRFSDHGLSTERDQFVAWLTKTASQLLTVKEQSRLADGIRYARLIEKFYREAIEVCERLAEGHEPSSVVWASIRLAHGEYVRWYRSITDELRQDCSGEAFSVKSRPSESYPERTFSDIVFAIDVTLSRELRLLGMPLGWFQNTLVIPKYSGAAPDILATSRFNAAAIFDQVENSDTRYRLFEGKYRELPDLPSALVRKNTATAVTMLSFSSSWHIAINVAGQRLQRRICQLIEKRRIASQTSFLSEKHEDELIRYLATEQFLFEELTGVDVMADGKKLAGLTVIEWLTGYSVLKFASQNYLNRSESDHAPCIISKQSLLHELCKAGMSEKSSNRFIHNCTFKWQSVDLHDCPLIAIENDFLCLLMFPANTQSCARLVLSQFAKKGIVIGEKGKILEHRLLSLFTQNGVDCSPYHRKIAGQEIEIDCLAIWQETLFVFECKNYALPSENPRHHYSFSLNQTNARQQLMAKIEAIRENPNIVSETFGKKATWNQVIPVVLNGMPFSLAGKIEGVFYSDFDSLQKFFEVGKVTRYAATVPGTPDVPGTGSPVSLWTNDKPQADDLVRLLEEPPFFNLIAETFVCAPFPVPVSPNTILFTEIVSQGESRVEEFARQYL